MTPYIFYLVLLILATVSNFAVHVEGKICVATAEDRYLCTDDAAKANAYRYRQQSNSFDFDMSDLGVEQQISGSKVETASVEEVISKMKEYFLTEVYAKPEYSAVRGKWYV